MRTRAVALSGLLSVMCCATSLFAIEIPHTDRDCVAIFVGTVIRTEVLSTNTFEQGFTFKWERWRAEVRIESVVKQDERLDATVFVYYSHDHSEPGRGWSMSCPGAPQIEQGLTARFQCVRRNIEGFGKVLCVPSHMWMEPLVNPVRIVTAVTNESRLNVEAAIPKRVPDATGRGGHLQR